MKRAAPTAENTTASAMPATGWRGHWLWLRRLGPVGLLAAGAAVMPPLGGFLLLGSLHWVGPWLAEQQWLGLGLYAAGFALLAGLALLPTYAQAVLGGWAFGFTGGFIAAMVGLTGAAMLGHRLAGRISGQRMMDLINEKPRFRAAHAALLDSGFWQTTLIVTLLRLPPNAPFAPVNVLLAAARVRPGPYLVGTLAGMAPRTGVVIFAAAELSQLDLSQPGQAWTAGASVVVSLIVLVVLWLVANRAVRRVAGAGQASEASRPG